MPASPLSAFLRLTVPPSPLPLIGELALLGVADCWDDKVHKCGYSLNAAYLDGDKKAMAVVPKMYTSGMSYRQAKNAAKARK